MTIFVQCVGGGWQYIKCGSTESPHVAGGYYIPAPLLNLWMSLGCPTNRHPVTTHREKRPWRRWREGDCARAAGCALQVWICHSYPKGWKRLLCNGDSRFWQIKDTVSQHPPPLFRLTNQPGRLIDMLKYLRICFPFREDIRIEHSNFFLRGVIDIADDTAKLDSAVSRTPQSQHYIFWIFRSNILDSRPTWTPLSWVQMC